VGVNSVVDLRWVLGAVGLLAVALALARQLYPGRLSRSSRRTLDVTILLCLIVAAALVLDLLGVF
jgi:hypothetical protein